MLFGAKLSWVARMRAQPKLKRKHKPPTRPQKGMRAGSAIMATNKHASNNKHWKMLHSVWSALRLGRGGRGGIMGGLRASCYKIT